MKKGNINKNIAQESVGLVEIHQSKISVGDVQKNFIHTQANKNPIVLKIAETNTTQSDSLDRHLICGKEERQKNIKSSGLRRNIKDGEPLFLKEIIILAQIAELKIVRFKQIILSHFLSIQNFVLRSKTEGPYVEGVI